MTLTLSSFFLIFSLLTLAYFFYRLKTSFNGDSFLSQIKSNHLAVAFSNLFLALYIPLVSFYIYARFEKTPSSEVIYLLIFLLGCLPELTRLFIPLETIQRSYPRFLVTAGRALFWGRSICVISLFAASIFSAKSKSIETEQNVFVILIFSLALASIVPVNTAKIGQSLSIEIGWQNFVIFLYIVTALLTAASYAVSANLNENPIYLRLGLGIACLETGFFILATSSILAISAAGAVLMAAGTTRALSALHKLYT